MASATANRIAMAIVDVGADFTRYFRDVARARNTTQAALGGLGGLTANLFNTAFKGAVGIVTELASHITRLGLSIVTLGGVITAGLSMAEFTHQMREAYNVFEEFQYGMQRVGAITGATGSSFRALTSEARRLGAETEHTASDAARAMNFFAKSGFSVNDILAATPATLDLATVGMLDMGTSADIVTKIMKGAGVQAADVGHAVDVLAKVVTSANTDLVQLGEAFKYVGPVGKLFGVTLEETAAAIQMMSDAGIQGSMAGTSFRNIMMRLASPSKEVKKVMDGIGFSAFDSTGKFKGLGKVLDELKAKTAGMGDQQRGAVLGDIGGVRAGAALMELVSQGGDVFRARAAANKAVDGFSASVRAKLLNTAQGARKIMESVFETVQLDLGLKMEPGTREVFQSLIDSLPKFGNALKDMMPVFDHIAKDVAGFIRNAGNVVGSKDGMFKDVGYMLAQSVDNVVHNLDKMGLSFEGLMPLIERFAQKIERVTAEPSASATEATDNFFGQYYAALAKMTPDLGFITRSQSGNRESLSELFERMANESFETAANTHRDISRSVGQRRTEESLHRIGQTLPDALKSFANFAKGPLDATMGYLKRNSSAPESFADRLLGGRELNVAGMIGDALHYIASFNPEKKTEEMATAAGLHIPDGAGVISDVMHYLTNMQQKLLRDDNDKRIAKATEETASRLVTTNAELAKLREKLGMQVAVFAGP